MIYCSKVSGHSMDLFIVEGDQIVYSDSKEYSFGDIVLYKCPKTGRLVCHRFFVRFGRNYLIAGDNNSYFELIKEDNLVGKGVMLIRTDKIRCNLKIIDKSRNLYCRLLLKCIILGYLSRKFSVFKRVYLRTVLARNKMQVKYVTDNCTI